MRDLGRSCEIPVCRACTKIFSGTVSERPKVQLSKSCVGVEPTVGSNPTGSASGLLANVSERCANVSPKEQAIGFPVAFSGSAAPCGGVVADALTDRLGLHGTLGASPRPPAMRSRRVP